MEMQNFSNKVFLWEGLHEHRVNLPTYDLFICCLCGCVFGKGAIVKILGIDPGCTGAIAIIDTANGRAKTFDAPVTNGKVNGRNKTMYQPDAMIDLLRQSQPIDLAVVEHQQVMGKEGVVSAFTIGYGYALWIMALVALKIPREIVKPADWKRVMLQGRDKELSRQRAIELFPALADELKLKKHHGRAEALLLCEFGKRLCCGGLSIGQAVSVQ